MHEMQMTYLLAAGIAAARIVAAVSYDRNGQMCGIQAAQHWARGVVAL